MIRSFTIIMDAKQQKGLLVLKALGIRLTVVMPF